MFHNLHIYTVHVKPGYRPGEDEPLFIREGFNIWGFLFTLMWAFYQRLWLIGSIILTFNICVGLLRSHGFITEGSSFVILLGSQAFIGFQGNDWIRDRLKRQNYITAGIVSGENLLRAEQRFFDHYATGYTSSAAA